MTLNDYMTAYMNNLIEKLELRTRSIDSIQFECSLCPLRAECQQAGEDGDERDCGTFLRDSFTDGASFRAV